jgi:hypothetical protein
MAARRVFNSFSSTRVRSDASLTVAGFAMLVLKGLTKTKRSWLQVCGLIAMEGVVQKRGPVRAPRNWR